MPCRHLESDKGSLRVAERVARACGAKGVGYGCADRKKQKASTYRCLSALRLVVDRGYTLLFYLVLYSVYNQLNNIYLQGVLFCFILYYFTHFWVKIWVKDF